MADIESKKSLYHTSTYRAAGTAMMDLTPINQIHQHLCAFHTYAHDRSRHVEAHHFCTYLSHDFHQCVIYDSDKPDARLIGIEYIVSEDIFNSLPPEEKKYWHSHKLEVESGVLQLQVKSTVPTAAVETAEQPAMLSLQTTYGKTIHTWAFDIHPDLPLGPPNLMMSYTAPDQIPTEQVKERDERLGMDTERVRESRKGYLLSGYEKAAGSDEWEKTGKGVRFEPIETNL